MSDRLLVATRKGLFRVERRGGEWIVGLAGFLGDHVSLVLPDVRDNTVYAALSHGHFGCKLHRAHDGQAWQEVTVPTYPSQPEGAEDVDLWGKPIPWKLQLIWALEPGLASQPGRLWCGSIPGGLFRSDDRGDSWQLLEGLWSHPQRKNWFGGGADLPGIHSICVDPRNAAHVAVGVSCGGVWCTEDDGQTWTCRAEGMRAAYMPPDRQFDPTIQDPHCLVRCASQPDGLWAQHHNGIFRSTDGSQSWTELVDVTVSSFGFAVAVDPHNPDVAWFIPGISDERRIPVNGQLVVTRTRDGGRSFEVLRKGLPQQHAYDLVFRHGLDVDETGSRLAFGSTTGSLFVSENQGDSWQCVATHLPPIYCVRFVRPR
jgi:hypothetical protein